MTKTIKQKTDAYQAGNRETAQIVLADVRRFGGEEALLVQWARLVLNPPTERSRPEIGRPA
jgi:hypothetical protein